MKSARASPRFEIDRAWLWRGLLVLAVLGFILVLAKASMMMVGSGNDRLAERERAIEQPAAAQLASPVQPPAAR